MDFVGQYVIVRSNPSGVWAGTVAAIDGTTVDLTHARRLWRWWSAEGVSLSGVAAAGLRADKLHDCRIAAPVFVRVYHVCEIILATDTARASIEAAPCE